MKIKTVYKVTYSVQVRKNGDWLNDEQCIAAEGDALNAAQLLAIELKNNGYYDQKMVGFEVRGVATIATDVLA